MRLVTTDQAAAKHSCTTAKDKRRLCWCVLAPPLLQRPCNSAHHAQDLCTGGETRRWHAWIGRDIGSGSLFAIFRKHLTSAINTRLFTNFQPPLVQASHLKNRGRTQSRQHKWLLSILARLSGNPFPDLLIMRLTMSPLCSLMGSYVDRWCQGHCSPQQVHVQWVLWIPVWVGARADLLRGLLRKVATPEDWKLMPRDFGEAGPGCLAFRLSSGWSAVR